MTTVMSPRAAAPADPPKRWTTAEFDRLVEDGYVEEGSGIYLWEGQIVEPVSENLPHWNAMTRLLKLLTTRLPKADWLVGQAPPFALEDGTKPHPDVLVARGPQSRYARAVPGPRDAALVVEVSGRPRSFERDRNERRLKYAASGVGQYWIVNVPALRVEVYHLTMPPSRTGEPRQREFLAPEFHGVGDLVPLTLTWDERSSEFAPVAVTDVLMDSLPPEVG